MWNAIISVRYCAASVNNTTLGLLDPALSVFFLLCFTRVLGCHARGGKEVRLGLFFSFPFFLGGLGEGVGVRDIFLVCSSLVGVLGMGTLGSTALEYSCMMRREGERWMSWLVAFQGSLHGGCCVALSSTW